MAIARSNGTWQQIRNVLFESLAENQRLQREAPAGSAAQQQATDNISEVLQQIRNHADVRLKQINDSAAAQSTLADLRTASSNAKAASDRIAGIAGTIDEATALVNDLAGLVGGFADIVL